jgi:hypothetical protein
MTQRGYSYPHVYVVVSAFPQTTAATVEQHPASLCESVPPLHCGGPGIACSQNLWSILRASRNPAPVTSSVDPTQRITSTHSR